MTAPVIGALCAGIAGIIGAVFNGIALVVHARNPAACKTNEPQDH